MSAPSILYLGSRGAGNLESSFLSAFQRLGCTVEFFDITGNEPLARLEAGTLSYRVANRLLRPLLDVVLSHELAELEVSRRYDLVFLHKNLHVDAYAIRALADRARALLFCYYPDHPFDELPIRANANTRALVPLVDCYFTFGHFIAPALHKAGARKIEYLPFARDPALHAPPLHPSERCQVAFVGTHSDERETLLRALLSIDIDLRIWGDGWQRAVRRDRRFARVVRGGARTGREFAAIYGSAEIGLNVIQAYDDGHNMRSFEAPACGGFVLSTRTPELVRLFAEDEEIACFSTPGELQTKVRYYLAHPEERNAIARRGFSRVEHDTYDVRARRIIEVWRQLMH